MRNAIIASTLALTLAGCSTVQGFGDRDTAREVLVGCQGIYHSLEVLTPNKDKLGSGAVSIVDHTVNVGEPLCTAVTPPVDARSTVRTLLLQISSIQAPEPDPAAIDPATLTIAMQIGMRLIDFGIRIAEVYAEDTDAADLKVLWDENVTQWQAAAVAWRGA